MLVPSNKILFFLACLFLSSCAGIVTDKRDVVVRVFSDPPAALVKANDNFYLTPASILIPRGEGPFHVILSKQGYRSEDILLTQTTDEPSVGWNALNLCLGCVVDVLNGSAFTVEPREIHRVLKKE